MKMQIEEEKIKETFFPENIWKIFFWEAFLFFLTLVLGIITSLRMLEIFKTIEGIEEVYPREPISLWQFIISFSILLIIILLIIKFVKFQRGKAILFKSIFIIAIGFGVLIFLWVWFGLSYALILTAILIILWLKRPSILLHNLILIIGIVGAANHLVLEIGLEPLIIIILLAIFSIYDFIAVYKTKHMIKMAKEMIEAGAISGIILPQKLSEVQTSLKDVKIGGRFLILGGGDIVFPLLLVSSLVPGSVLKSLIVAIFATIGLLVSIFIFISQKTRKPIPALPSIALFSIIGYLITHFLRI